MSHGGGQRLSRVPGGSRPLTAGEQFGCLGAAGLVFTLPFFAHQRHLQHPFFSESFFLSLFQVLILACLTAFLVALNLFLLNQWVCAYSGAGWKQEWGLLFAFSIVLIVTGLLVTGWTGYGKDLNWTAILAGAGLLAVLSVVMTGLRVILFRSTSR